MIRFLAKRLGQAIVVILLVTVIVFLLLHSVPGGPARGILGPQASPQAIAAFNHEHGFDKSLVQQYWAFLSRLLHGDLGDSYTLNQSVGSLIGQRLPKTLVLTGLSTLVALVIAIPLGVWQGRRRRGLTDYAVTTLVFIGYATPVFFLALILVIVFTEKIPILPPQAPQAQTLGALFADSRALILPVLAGAIATVAAFSRYMRSAVLDNLAEDYVRTARAKGASERRVVWLHIMRNSLTPIIAMLGYYLPVLFSGALVIESVFNYPGMGLLFWNAAQTSDYPILLGTVLVIALATVIGSLLADIVQALVDPRVRGSIR
ncbi:ABC transporter permease [Actinoallomurus rhizosphaericola]|uniref:ABC transporter permease n=1 Tax=Actinoallomurus rhizosphaericola TaxID=2952536 RepID=UPI0020936945|nr:ABC transporter permease [Actinoallomurus rhizosphaericola]MCO5998796.1 ABC transporter permease [Actinoallomurus rhizosphaericola]